MDQESIVYGCIKDVVDGQDNTQRLEINRKAMLSLPSIEDWPLVSREMFSLPSYQDGHKTYQTEVIHFGASYKAVEYEWSQWIEQFEALLSRMYWVSATVHLETEISGTHTFTWYAKGSCHEPGSNAMNVKCEWSHEGALQI